MEKIHSHFSNSRDVKYHLLEAELKYNFNFVELSAVSIKCVLIDRFNLLYGIKIVHKSVINSLPTVTVHGIKTLNGAKRHYINVSFLK